MLKESRELDALLPDLLLAMGFDLLSRPGVGPRQFGVDLSATGIDPKDQTEKLFLLTVKEGNLTRSDWDSGKNAVRQSLNEIQDSYLRTRVRPEHEKLPKKIVLVTGGELKQDVEPDWVNYVHSHAGVHPKYGRIEFDFWGGDALTLLIDRFLLDEYLFPESTQKHLRKTIALADQNEDEPRYFYELIEEILFRSDLSKDKEKKSAKQQRQKAFHLLNLSLNIVFHWCQEANNLKPALLCAERTVLRAWDWIRQADLFSCKATFEEFLQIFFSYFNIANNYAIKIQPHCFVKDGFFGYGMVDELEYPLRTFEVIGTLGLLGISHWYFAQAYQDEENRGSHFEQAQAVAESLAALIQNNPSASSPRYDNHAIDISLGLLALTTTGHNDYAAKWIRAISIHIVRAYQLGKNFPIASDSYDQLIAMRFGQAPPKEKLMDLSTLLPILADWYAILDLTDEYQLFQESMAKVFPSTDFQLWYPDEQTDTYIYSRNAGYASGITVASLRLPKTLDELKVQIIRLREQQQSFRQLSCFTHGFPSLALMSSRHFRTPVIPAYWQHDVITPHLTSQNNVDEDVKDSR
jgi:hypothetical protein